MLRIGVDIGGTFTDFSVWDGNDGGYTSVDAFKVPSTPPHFAQGVIQGVEKLLAAGRVKPEQEMLIVHGTTVSTNAVIERSGSPVGLLTTRGFRNILDIARLRLENPFDLFAHRAKPLMPTRLVAEVDERIRADGAIDTPIDEASVIAAGQKVVDAGAQAICVCFIHSYCNPAHEQRAGAILREHFDLDIMLSHEVWPQESEYERANAVLLNAYAKRAMSGYLIELRDYLASRLPNTRLLITKSNGGAMTAAEATRFPIHSLLSGPAAGVNASSVLGSMLGEPNLLTMDMGGTSTDISIVRDGTGIVSHEGKVGDFPIVMPVTAIEAIGAGGGSIAWMDGSVLKIGPRSAGANPGPACYGKGGSQPTLSDAYLLCGYLAEDSMLDSGVALHRGLAEQAMAPLAAAIGSDVTTTAESCLAVATANMLANTLPFIAKLGVSPSELTLMIFGGAGAIHGPLLAEEVGIGRIIVPRVSSVFCAYGCLVSDLLLDLVAPLQRARQSSRTVRDEFVRLRRAGTQWLAQQGKQDDIEFAYSASTRYAGQSFDVLTPLPEAIATSGDVDSIARLFHAEHDRVFKHSYPDGDVVITALHLRSRGALPRPGGAPLASPDQQPIVAPMRVSEARFNGSWQKTPHYNQAELPAGWRGKGPAIIVQPASTTLVPPGFDVSIGAYGDVFMSRSA